MCENEQILHVKVLKSKHEEKDQILIKQKLVEQLSN